jgi:predicted SAM-dependent methyltransferase
VSLFLNFGCGSIQPAGWINVDRQDFGQGLVVDLLDHGSYPAFPDGHFDGIVASHSLQENGYDELPVVLVELRRILRPGGVLRVLWPDVAAAVRAWQAGDRAWFPINDNEPDLDDKFAVYLNWFGTARTLCTAPRLVTLLERAGFVNVTRDAFGVSRLAGLAALDDREPEDQIIMEATAP